MQQNLVERASVKDSSAIARASFVRVSRVHAERELVRRFPLPVRVAGCRGAVAAVGVAAKRVDGIPRVYSRSQFFLVLPVIINSV